MGSSEANAESLSQDAAPALHEGKVVQDPSFKDISSCDAQKTLVEGLIAPYAWFLEENANIPKRYDLKKKHFESYGDLDSIERLNLFKEQHPRPQIHIRIEGDSDFDETVCYHFCEFYCCGPNELWRSKCNSFFVRFGQMTNGGNGQYYLTYHYDDTILRKHSEQWTVTPCDMSTGQCRFRT